MNAAAAKAGQTVDLGLNERELASVRSILREFPEIKLVYVYGSRAKGNYKAGSDIDLAIMEPPTDLRLRSKIQSLFNDSPLPMRVDLVDFHSLESDSLKAHILRVGLPIYKAES